MKKTTNNIKKFDNNFFSKYSLVIVITIMSIILSFFLYLLFNYKSVYKLDIDGYMISKELTESLKSDEISENTVINVVKMKSNDSIYKNSFDYYVNEDKKKQVNIDYPLFVDNGFALVNYNSNINLVDNDFERIVGQESLILSYGKIYDSVDYTQMDNEKYILLSYEDGTYINLYDLEIKTTSNTYNIPINSFLYFFEDKLNYYERTNDSFVKKTIKDIDFNTIINFYYDGLKENFEYTYEELLSGLGTIYIEEEIPDYEDIPSGDQNNDPEQDEEIINPEDAPSKPQKPSDNFAENERVWIKPKVKSSELTANVYSLEGNIQISDPAGVIVKAPTYTLYKHNKIYSRRAFYSSGNIVISGLSSESEYYIVGQYTYLDEDFKTKKIVTFYTGKLTTLNRDTLKPIELTHENGEIHSKKIVINNVGINSDLNDEALRGVKSLKLIINGNTYGISTKLLQLMLLGEKVTIETAESLKSNSDQNFELAFYDRDNNKIKTTGASGKTRTSKIEPIVFLRQLESDNINIKVGVELRNDDDAWMNDYKYTVIDSSGKIVASDFITDNNFTIKDLNPNQIFTLKVTADVDLNNEKGITDDFLLGDMTLSTLPISSLGFVNLKMKEEQITSYSARISLEINLSKTDQILLQLLKELTINIYDAQTEEKISTKKITSNKLEELKKGKKDSILFDNLQSNKKYKIELKSLVVQGQTEYDLDCIYNLDEFETRKKEAKVLIVNSFTSNNMIDFDCIVEDTDGAILSGKVAVELRDNKQNIVKSQLIDVNTEDYIRITYNNLKERENYTLYFYANEYNETNLNSEYQSRKDLKRLDIFTEEGISGKIELVSSMRKATGTNLIDFKSDVKWMQSYHHYNIPSVMDEDGQMHIYSKNGASAYTYDLSEYRGKMVTATFKIKAITPVDPKYKIYFSNAMTGSTSVNRGIELTNLSTENFKTFSYTFIVGQQYVNTTYYSEVTSYTYGRNQAEYAGFYITGGTAQLAEYEVKDFQVSIISQYDEAFTYNDTLDNIDWSTNNNKTITQTTKVVSTKQLIPVEAGYYYFLDYNTYYANVQFWSKSTGKYVKQTGNIREAMTFYVSEDSDIVIEFRGLTTNEGQPDLNIEDVEYSLVKYKKGNSPSYQEFEYTLETKVSVDLVDIRSEITNRDYYITIYEDGQQIDQHNYVELLNSIKLENVIKELDLKENKNYKIELGIKIRDRYYALSDFDITTTGEVMGISTLDEWSRMQPRGNYIILNDLDFSTYTLQHLGFGYRYFYGSIDFQGYTMTNHMSNSYFNRIGRMESSAVIKNLVLDIYMDHDVNRDSRYFFTTNYGLIENVQINFYDTADDKYLIRYFSGLVNSNQRVGTIRNFTLNVVDDIGLYIESALITRHNYGTIENGYVYGEGSIVPTPEVTSGTSRSVSFIERYGGSRSKVERVFVLPSIKFLSNNNYDWDVTGLIAHESYGEINNSYVLGNVNPARVNKGPAIFTAQGTFVSENLYYLNDSLYTDTFHQKINATALNDITFQKSVLKDSFTIDEMIELGYYPQVKYSSNKMPSQPYIELPKILEDNLIDIVSMEIIEQTNNSAIVEFYISNIEGEEITEIVIADVDTKIIEQTFEDGKSKVKVSITNPRTYVSKYSIRSVSSMSFLGYISKRQYDIGEKHAVISFYKEIYTVSDWRAINSGLNQNYILMNDLNFLGESNINITTFSGKIDGNNHTIKNIDIIKYDGLFNQMNGILQNINFENITKETNTTNSGGVAGYSNKNGRYYNVHVKNVTINVHPNRTTDGFYAGGLVGNISSARISDSSVTNVKITSDVNINNIAIGGLVGNASAVTISNSYAQNVKLSASKSMSMYGIGGLVGREGSTVGYIENSYATGTVNNDNYYTGGLVGYSAGIIEKCYSSVHITSDLDYLGGITGRAQDSTYILNNLYVGNIYNPKGETSKIVPGVVVDPSNVSLTSSLVNGTVSDLNNGETTVSYNDLFKKSTYEDVITLGEDYDYSKTTSGILPKLYYSNKDELLPNQIDEYIYKDLFGINNVVIDKHADYALVVVYLENPDNYIITDIVVENMDIEILKNNNINDLAVIEFRATPKIYVDTYKLNQITYKEKEDSTETKTFDKNYKLDMIFYKSINNITDWQDISNTIAENYLLMSDLDFTDRKDVNTGVIFNRLETTGAHEVHTIKGIDITTNTDVNSLSFIQRVYANMQNITFEDITITDTSTKTNSYIDLIRNNYGDMNNVTFKNIEINAPNENQVSIIGRNYGQTIENINLDNIKVTGRATVGGFIAYAENSSERIYNNITATNMNVTGLKGEVGGIFGNMVSSTSNRTRLVTNISISNSSVTAGDQYVGGIAGLGEVNDSIVQNVTVTGTRYVGGLIGYQRSAYMVANKIIDSTVSGTIDYIGGSTGRSLQQEDSEVINTKVLSLNASTYGVGGFTGIHGSYTITRCGVKDSIITGPGYNHGGFSGNQTGGTLSYNFVENTTVNAYHNVGGFIGQLATGAAITTNHITETLVNATDSYAGGIVGLLNNEEKLTSHIRNNYVTDVDVISNIYAGGLVGGANFEIYNAENNSYGQYFEGSVQSQTQGTAGVGSGDNTNDGFISLTRTYAYEDSIINNKKVKELAINDSNSENLLLTTQMYDGYILSDVDGNMQTHYQYPNASSTDFIDLKENKTYEIELKTTGSTDWFRMVVYTPEGTFVETSDAGNSYLYIGYNTSFSGVKKATLKIQRDCKIKLYFYDITNLSSYSLKEIKSGEGDIDKSQVLDYKDLKDRITWTRYLEDSKKNDYYYETKLNYSFDRYDWSLLNYKLQPFNIKDLSNNGHNATANVNAITKYGLMFDGIDDEINISNYEQTQTFTISATITQTTNSSPGYQFLFTSENFNEKTNGAGMFIHGRTLYARINGTNYSSTAIPRGEEVNVTITYDENKYLRFYVNGQAFNESRPNKVINTLKSSAAISPLYMEGTNQRRFAGAMRKLQVYDRALTQEEIANNYNTDSIINNQGLQIYYDFSNMEYKSGDGYYPTMISNTIDYDMLEQKTTTLPSEENRNYNQTPATFSRINLVDKKLDSISKIYASSVNTINIEFDETYDDLSFEYQYGSFKSNKVEVENRVYSLTYDFNSDLEITLTSSNDTEQIKLTPEDLARKLYIDSDNYYHITDNILYNKDNLILENALNVYDGLVLLQSNKIYDLKNNKELSSNLTEGILTKAIPLYENIIDNTNIKTYYNFTKITDIDGNISYRDGQLMVKNNKLYMFDKNNEVKQNMNIFNTYNTKEYQISLEDNYLKSLKEQINYPNYFNNFDIEEISFDINSNIPIIMIRYSNNHIYVFNYYNAEELFTYGEKTNLSLLNFMFRSFSRKPNPSSDETYNSSENLIDTLNNLTNQEIKDMLYTEEENTNIQNDNITPPENSDDSLVEIPSEKIINNYLKVYNNNTNEYEVYSAEELLNPKKEQIKSETYKIKSNTFLYNYFYNKTNKIENSTRNIIYIIIIGLVIINLIALAIHLNNKEVKKNA